MQLFVRLLQLSLERSGTDFDPLLEKPVQTHKSDIPFFAAFGGSFEYQGA